MPARKSKINPETLPADRAPAAKGIKNHAGPKPSRRITPAALPDNENILVLYFRMGGAARTLEGLHASLKGTPFEHSLDDLRYMSKTYRWDERLKVWDAEFERDLKEKAKEMRFVDLDLAIEIQMGELQSFKEARDFYREQAAASGQPPPTLLGSQQDISLAVKNLILLSSVNADGSPKGGDGEGGAARVKAEAESARAMFQMFATMAAAMGLKVMPAVGGGLMPGVAGPGQAGGVLDIPAQRALEKGGEVLSERDMMDALHAQAKKGGDV